MGGGEKEKNITPIAGKVSCPDNSTGTGTLYFGYRNIFTCTCIMLDYEFGSAGKSITTACQRELRSSPEHRHRATSYNCSP